MFSIFQIKNTFRLKKTFLLLILFSYCQSYAQQRFADSVYAKDPLWIGMIDNPNTNYYEALKAFDLYFKVNKMPEEPEELAQESIKNGTYDQIPVSRNLTPKELAEKEAEQELALQIKRFKHWKRDVLPFVQEGGYILNGEERIKLWEEVSGRSRHGGVYHPQQTNQ